MVRCAALLLHALSKFAFGSVPSLCRSLLYQCLENENFNVLEHLDQNGGYSTSDQLLQDLMIMHDSLKQSGDLQVAGGPLNDLIRQVSLVVGLKPLCCFDTL